LASWKSLPGCTPLEDLRVISGPHKATTGEK
jgi:hypothetical protein